MLVTGFNSFYYLKTFEIPYSEDHEEFKKGDLIIFLDPENQEELGQILYAKKTVPEDHEISKEGSILRRLTDRDRQKMITNQELAREALKVCKEKIKKHKLDMQLQDAVYSLDGTKLNFIFTADERIDFRELVKDLALRFQKQIHLQQIGLRDKARMIKGFGKCGRELCCTRFLGKLESITMDMVRTQNLISKGSEKLSGCCGKLMCCLAYEIAEYELLRQELPELGSEIEIKTGVKGIAVGLDILNQKIKLQTEGRDYQIILASEIKKITPPKSAGLPRLSGRQAGGRQAPGKEIKPEELEKLEKEEKKMSPKDRD